jgi:hypothetical protein
MTSAQFKLARFKRKGFTTTCPNCFKVIRFPGLTEEQVNDCTSDCCNCGALLITKKGKTYLMHEWMHSQDSRWPKDGKGTGYITI